jgi:hypothetical protein
MPDIRTSGKNDMIDVRLIVAVIAISLILVGVAARRRRPVALGTATWPKESRWQTGPKLAGAVPPY